MSILTPIPPETPLPQRLFFNIPVVGWFARDVAFGDPDNLLWAAVIVASLWVLAVAFWGVVALLVPFTLAIPAALYGVFAIMVWQHDRKAAASAEDDQPNG